MGFNQVYCTYCMNQINDVLLQCNECYLELCIQCYVCGCEIGQHLKTHMVKMIDLGTFSVFGSKRKRSNKKKGIKMEIDDDEELVDDIIKNEENVSSDESYCSEVEVNKDDEEEDESNDETEEAKKPITGRRSERFYYELDRGQLIKRLDEDEKLRRQLANKERVWRALDELELLEALSRFGFGNWKDIAQALSRTMEGITPEEVADHYSIYYILSDIGDYTWDWKKDTEHISNIFVANEDRKLLQSAGESTYDDISQLEFNTIGFMPKRDDFELEFDNEAEGLIANLTVGPGEEDEIEKKFKLAQIEMYQQRLVERFRKKAIVRKYGLVRKFLKANQIKQEKENDEKSEIPANMVTPSTSSGGDKVANHLEPSAAFSPFLRFGSEKDLQNLYLELYREYYLKVVIRKLLKYKRRGLTTLEEIKEFEDMKKSKTLKRKAQQMKDNLENDDSSSDESSEDELAFSLDDASFKRILAPISSKKMQEIMTIFATDDSSQEEIKIEDEVGEEDEEEETEGEDLKLPPKLGRKNRRKSHRANDFDVNSFPRCRLLLESEKELCSEIKLRPSIFLALKALVLKEFNSRQVHKSRRISVPFVLINEPAAVQAAIQAAFGSNITNDEVDLIMNRVIELLQSNGTIS